MPGPEQSQETDFEPEMTGAGAVMTSKQIPRAIELRFGMTSLLGFHFRIKYGQSSSFADSRTEISLAEDVSQERSGRGHSRVVWRGRRQALCDDSQRHGKDEADSEQSKSYGGAVHDSWEGDRGGVSRDGAHFAAGGACAGAADDQSKVLDGAASASLGEDGYVYRT